MSGRGARKRGRPPKTPSNDRNKFNYSLLKKPKYLTKGNDSSRFSTPSASRASSPQESDGSRRSSSRARAGGSRGRGRRGYSYGNTSAYANRKDYESEYHYGSDFGDSTGDDDVDDDPLIMSESDREDSLEGDAADDSDFSVESFVHNGVGRPPRPPSPDPVWLQDREYDRLEVPFSSDDLLIPRQYVMKSIGIYEVIRRFRNLVRLSPFRFEDFCAALINVEQSALLTEIHIMLLKAILREEDTQQTHFGPLDQKDSINISLYLIDQITWPDVLRSYIDSDKTFDRHVHEVLSQKEYPYTGIEDRLDVLQFLTDQFLITTSIRDVMLQEGPIHYDDHCRSCHRLGDLLCCETCPAVFHLECVDPPLIDVPSEDWQCTICKSHRMSGVTDCILPQEKQTVLIRNDCLGVDRHGRKYWFLSRRILVEDVEGDNTCWYFSSWPQFQQFYEHMDKTDLEQGLCREIEDRKEDIQKHMLLTESLTNENKLQNVNSYLENFNEKIEEKLTPHMEITEEGDDVRTEPKEVEPLTEEEVKSIEGFKLGEDGEFKNYVNQYVVNVIALNKPQRNEERDKKRHLSHKFSLTTASEFKWSGIVNGADESVANTLRQTLLTLEQAIFTAFMNPNWTNLRKLWVNAVASAQKPQDFSAVIALLISCFKSVIYANVWHEQLGHLRLQRITANEREERKKIEKREKREMMDEEERNRLSVNYVKYSLGLKHQVWKQKGEEYRIHGQWGWAWLSKGRRSHAKRFRQAQERIPAAQISMRIKKDNADRIITIDPKTYAFLQQCKEGISKGQEFGYISEYKDIEFPQINEEFDYIDVSKALKSVGRLYYPKIARKSKLDGMLAHREKLYELELQSTKIKEDNEESVLPPEPSTSSFPAEKSKHHPSLLEKQILRLASLNKSNGANSTNATTNENVNMELVNALAKKITQAREKFSSLNRFAKSYKCYTRECNINSNAVSQISQCTCYSPLCLQKARAKKELLVHLRKAHTVGNGSKDTVQAIMGAVKKPVSILESKLTEGKKPTSTFSLDDANNVETQNDIPVDLHQDFKSALTVFIQYEDEVVQECLVASKEEAPPIKNETIPAEPMDTTEIKKEDDPMDGAESDNSENEVLSKKAKFNETPDNIDICNTVEIESSESLSQFDTAGSLLDIDENSSSGPLKMRSNGGRKSTRNLKGRQSMSTKLKSSNENSMDDSSHSSKSNKNDLSSNNIEVASQKLRKPNRRFPFPVPAKVKKEERKVEKELAPNGSEKLYSTTYPCGRIYLIRSSNDIQSGKPPIKNIKCKFPPITTFQTYKSNRKSIMLLPRMELHKLARSGGRNQANGFHHLAKNNQSVWSYPCARPLFKTTWLYRLMNCENLSSIALQFRILWCCLRWDDMQMKSNYPDGKQQITSETEIVTLELLKMRYLGKFSERAQYLRRKIVIPLELPKTIREVTSIRSGLRKRKRAESPQQTEPQVTEEWIDEDKLELCEVKQFGEKQDKSVTITRTVTGKLPPQRTFDNSSSSSSSSSSRYSIGPARSNEELKEKMEQQLKIQRQQHQQKTIQRVTGTPTSTANKQVVIGNRRVIVKNADGTTKIVHQTITAPSPKTPQTSTATSQTNSPSTQPATPTPHKVQIIRGADGKVSVRGLAPGQQLIQMPDGKLHVLTTTPGSAAQKTITLKPAGSSAGISTTPKPITTAITKAIQQPPQQTTPVSNKQPQQQTILRQTPTGTQKTQIQVPANMTQVKQIIQQTTKTPGQTVKITGNQIISKPQTVVSGVQTSTSVSANPTPTKILTSSGQIVTAGTPNVPQQTQKILTTAGTASGTNLQQLLVQSGQKLIVTQNAQGQKVLIQAQPQQQQPQLVQASSPQQQPQQQQQQQVILNSSPTQPQQQQKVVQQFVNTSNTQQQIMIGGQRIVLQPGQTIVTRTVPQTSQVQVLQQQIIPPQSPQHNQQQASQQQVLLHSPTQTLVQSNKPKIQNQVIVQQAQPQQQQQQQVVVQQQQQQQQQGLQTTQQIVVQNSNLAQQLAQGKLQVATINNQQVIIKPLGNNQAQIVAHIKTQSDGNSHIVTSIADNQSPEPQSPPPAPQQQKIIQQRIQVQQPTQVAVQQQQQQQPQQQQSQQPSTTEQALLAGQPPGTVIKCVTAQVIQTEQGPRIVLQGLAGNDFTAAQLALVQQQVKQQLLKAQESSGKQGVLGPTKIYLAVQPPTPGNPQSQSQPPPLAPVQQSPQQGACNNEECIYEDNQRINGATTTQNNFLNTNQQPQITTATNFNNQSDLMDNSAGNLLDSGSFVLTPDYIQETIKTALKQDNLNPDIEEKLINFQKYQESQLKPDSSIIQSVSSTLSPPTSIIETLHQQQSQPLQHHSILNSNSFDNSLSSPPHSPVKVRKRQTNKHDDDEDWVMDTPRKRNNISSNRSSYSTRGVQLNSPILHEEQNDLDDSDLSQDEDHISTQVNRKVAAIKREMERKKPSYQMMQKLNRHKESLKKEMAKKRQIMEQELNDEIQEELAAEVSMKREYPDVDIVDSHPSNTTVEDMISSPPLPSSPIHSVIRNRTTSTKSNGESGKKREKLYCICRTPYDDTKFYVGCDMCNNWFHGDCVGISEDDSKDLTEFICDECKQAKENQELYCLCRQPYDESQFYICCDKCQDWFHGRCVGILQSEAEQIDEYICPNCHRNSSVNYANMKNLSTREYSELSVLIKDIQNHTSAWPFMLPVDPEEAPDYYKVIKEPMDLKKVEMKIATQVYTKLTEFIGDMTKIFDNCRFYNPKDTSFYKCADKLEAYFVQRIKDFRDNLMNS